MEEDIFPIIREAQQKVLTMFQFKSRGFLSMEAMLRRTMRINFDYDYLTDRMLITLRAQVLEDPDRRQREMVRFEEYPRYETWRAHLVDSLPRDSFRRRFLSRLWDFGDTEVLGKRIIHEVTFERRLLFPDSSVPTDHYPPELGQAGWIYQVRHTVHDPYSEDYR